MQGIKSIKCLVLILASTTILANQKISTTGLSIGLGLNNNELYLGKNNSITENKVDFGECKNMNIDFNDLSKICLMRTFITNTLLT